MHGEYKINLSTNYKGLNLMELTNGNGDKLGVYLDTEDYDKIEAFMSAEIEAKYVAERKAKERQEHEDLNKLLTKMGD